MSIKIEGLNEVIGKLQELQSRARRLDGTHQVPAGELFSHEFMRRNSRFGSFDEMLAASGFHVETTEDFAAIPDQEWDAFVRASTSFPDWKAMQEAAATEWAGRKLGLR